MTIIVLGRLGRAGGRRGRRDDDGHLNVDMLLVGLLFNYVMSRQFISFSLYVSLLPQHGSEASVAASRIHPSSLKRLQLRGQNFS